MWSIVSSWGWNGYAGLKGDWTYGGDVVGVWVAGGTGTVVGVDDYLETDAGVVGNAVDDGIPSPGGRVNI